MEKKTRWTGLLGLPEQYYRPGDLNRFHIGQYGTVSQRWQWAEIWMKRGSLKCPCWGEHSRGEERVQRAWGEDMPWDFLGDKNSVAGAQWEETGRKGSYIEALTTIMTGSFFEMGSLGRILSRSLTWSDLYFKSNTSVGNKLAERESTETDLEIVQVSGVAGIVAMEVLKSSQFWIRHNRIYWWIRCRT